MQEGDDVVRFQNVGMRYELGREILHDISLRLKAGSFHLLTGESGAGKSSLLDAITWALWGKARAKRDEDLIHLGQGDMYVQLDFEQEGTTYSDLITEWRRRQAQRYLSQADPEIASISARLGYSHPVGFHRAFKRWTGTTPLAYHRVLARLRIRQVGS